MTSSLLTVTLAHAAKGFQVSSFTVALGFVAEAFATTTAHLVNVFDPGTPGMVAVYVDSDESQPVAVIARG